MTRKDFVLIAEVVSQIEDGWTRDITAKRFAAMLAATNPSFDAPRFLTACGVME